MRRHPIFAGMYDWLLRGNEDAGLRELRAELLGSASGKTLEIGAGTGLNLEHYPNAVTQLVLAEPDPHMATRLRERLAARAPAVRTVEVIDARAEQLPFADDSFDTVVSTLVLCSVSDPRLTAGEMRRVLRPGGHLLYIEHVRDQDGTRRARWQDRLERPWGTFMGGCHPNRESGAILADVFGTSSPDRGEFPGPGTALVKPLISGTLPADSSGS